MAGVSYCQQSGFSPENRLYGHCGAKPTAPVLEADAGTAGNKEAGAVKAGRTADFVRLYVDSRVNRV